MKLEERVQASPSAPMIEIVKFDVQRLPQVAILYDQVFTAPPWNDPPLGEEKAIEYITGELSKSLAVAYLAIANDSPVGFAWGYMTSASGFATSKYVEPDNRLYIFNMVPKRKCFYIDEVGMAPDYRKKGYATQMVDMLTEDESSLLMRTMKGSPMEKIAARLQMVKLDIKDPEDTRRVIYYRL